MADSTNRPILRAAAEEFRYVFTVRPSDLVPQLATHTLPWRIATLAGTLFWVLWLWFTVAIFRGGMIDWLPAADLVVGPYQASSTAGTVAYAYMSARVVGLVLLWALWALGGLLPVALALAAGWAWPSRRSGAQVLPTRRFA